MLGLKETNMPESTQAQEDAEAAMAAGDYARARKLLVQARFSITDTIKKQELLDLQLFCERQLIDEMNESVNRAQAMIKTGDKKEALHQFETALKVADTLGTPTATQQRAAIADALTDLCLSLRMHARAHEYATIAGRPIRTVDAQPFSLTLPALKSRGLLQDLTDDLLAELLEDQTLDDVDAIQFLTSYYDFGLSERGIADGFLAHDWRFGSETEDVVAEFSALIAKEPLLKLIKFENSPSRVTLHVQRKSGEQLSVDFGGALDEVAAIFNRELEREGDGRRFVSLETHADFFAYYLFDLASYKEFCQSKKAFLPAMAVPGVDASEWDVLFVRAG